MMLRRVEFAYKNVMELGLVLTNRHKLKDENNTTLTEARSRAGDDANPALIHAQPQSARRGSQDRELPTKPADIKNAFARPHA